MMLADDYVCPVCNKFLRQEANAGALRLACELGHVFRVDGNTPNFTYPEKLQESDEEFKTKYNACAESYDIGMDWLFGCFYEKEDDVRNEIVDLLEMKPDQTILEVGCGTGQDSLYISKRLGKNGKLYLQDLSSKMIDIAQEKLKNFAPNVQKKYFISNASYLPFPDNYFDALYHFGGLNTFSELEKALEEMTRVVKVDGRIVLGDEGVAPWLKNDEYGKFLVKANPLYRYEPPVSLLPKNSRNVSLHWVLGNAFYIIPYKKGKSIPLLNMDLPIPGIRGGTLRSRYQENSVSGVTGCDDRR